MTHNIYKEGLYPYIEKRAIDIRETMPEYENSFDSEYNDLVIYDGVFPSQLFIVGRDLGKDEVVKHTPFIGKSGKLVRQTLKVSGINVNSIYITNIVPYKPAGNKVFPETVRKEFGRLVNVQLKIGKPRYVIATGKESIEHFVKKNIKSVLSYCRKNMVVPITCKTFGGVHTYQLIPVPHPSYFIRKGVSLSDLQSNPEFIELFYNKFKFVSQQLGLSEKHPTNNNKLGQATKGAKSFYVRNIVYQKNNFPEQKQVFVLEETDTYIFGIDLNKINAKYKDVLLLTDDVISSGGTKIGLRKYLKSKILKME